MSASGLEPVNLTTETGRLIKYHSNFFYVDYQAETYTCSLKGLLKKSLKMTDDTILVGDFVELDSIDAVSKTARIASIQSRQNQIARPKIANVTHAMIVCTIAQPAFDFQQTDRYLTQILLAGLKPVICISKADLLSDQTLLKEIQTIYELQLHIKLIVTSVFNQASLAPLKAVTENQITVLAGPSGAGKSSLLNALNPNLNIRVGEVSEKIERGQHTTRHVELIHMGQDKQGATYIADTPGFSHLKLDQCLPVEIQNAFAELTDLNCLYSDCLHLPESDGCTLTENDTRISKSRYQSYCTFVGEAKSFETQLKQTSQKQELGFKTLNQKGSQSLHIPRIKSKDREADRRHHKQKLTNYHYDMDTQNDDSD